MELNLTAHYYSVWSIYALWPMRSSRSNGISESASDEGFRGSTALLFPTRPPSPPFGTNLLNMLQRRILAYSILFQKTS